MVPKKDFLDLIMEEVENPKYVYNPQVLEKIEKSSASSKFVLKKEETISENIDLKEDIEKGHLIIITHKTFLEIVDKMCNDNVLERSVHGFRLARGFFKEYRNNIQETKGL